MTTKPKSKPTKSGAKTSKRFVLRVVVTASRRLTRTEVRDWFDSMVELGMNENMNNPISFWRVTNADLD